MKIVLDAGHGYNTPGKRTVDGTMREWEFNNAVANEMKALLGQYEGVSVLFVHDTTGKTDVSLSNRTKKANDWGANCYVSIHGNAYGTGWNDANGIETFVYTTRPREAVALAEKVQAQLIKATGLRNRGVKSANFQVIRETKMTSILVECGFMSNQKEAALLKSADYRKKCAVAIVNGLVEQYKLKKKASAAPAPTPSPTKAKTIFFDTGGYVGDALLKIHGFLMANKWWYQPSRSDSGAMLFLIGGFAEGSADAKKMEQFLKDNKYWYQIK